MDTAILSDGAVYYIPKADLSFFKELAARMKWETVRKSRASEHESSTKSWADHFVGKWKDQRTTQQIVDDIHAARTSNGELTL